MRRKSCDNCREGVTCRACGAPLLPIPALLTPQDYTALLTAIDGSDRKYAPKILDALAALWKCERENAKARLSRLRAKLRGLLAESQRKTSIAPGAQASAPPDREEIMRRAKTGEISYDEALKLLETI